MYSPAQQPVNQSVKASSHTTFDDLIASLDDMLETKDDVKNDAKDEV